MFHCGAKIFLTASARLPLGVDATFFRVGRFSSARRGIGRGGMGATDLNGKHEEWIVTIGMQQPVTVQSTPRGYVVQSTWVGA